MISGRGCRNEDRVVDGNQQQNVVIHQPVEQPQQYNSYKVVDEEHQAVIPKNNDGQGQEHKKIDAQKGDDSLPIIYAVTPTYARPLQKAELTR